MTEPGSSWALAARLARRELRAGARGFRIFIACLALGVAAIAAPDYTTRISKRYDAVRYFAYDHGSGADDRVPANDHSIVDAGTEPNCRTLPNLDVSSEGRAWSNA